MIARYTTSALTAAGMTAALLLLMQSLVALGQPTTPAGRVPTILGYVSVPIPPPLPQPAPAWEKPPSPPGNRPGTGPELYELPPAATPFVPPAPPTIVPEPVAGINDGPLVALVRPRPDYPLAATTKGLEGYVLVQFDVGADGTVGNVTVVESSNPLFERSAIAATLRTRYKARVIDGVPLPSTGIRNLLTYRMEGR